VSVELVRRATALLGADRPAPEEELEEIFAPSFRPSGS
jgi:hypothetical protein